MLPFALLTAGAATLDAQTPDAVIVNGYQAHPTRILVKFKDESGPVRHATEMRQFGAQVHRRYRGLPRLAVLDEDKSLAGSAPTNQLARRTRLLQRIEQLKQSGLFEYVEPDYIVHPTLAPTDAAFVDGRLWGLRNTGQSGGTPGADISAPDAWDITTGSQNVIVAVIDTGVRYTHQDLVSQMWHNPLEIPGNGVDDDGDGYVDDVFGINAVTGSGDPMDIWEHGTHVAGTIGASANDAGPHVGVNWHIQIMALKFLNPSGATSDAIECIDYAVAHGARILNNSWGGVGFSMALQDAIERAREAGVLFVAAAGNGGFDGVGDNNDQIPFYPASYELDNIISVAALDRNDRLADFSNFGRNTVDIGAPGVEIFSCISDSDTSYDIFDGTSMAAPHVSGVAALVLSRYPTAGLDELRARVLSGAVPISALNGKCTTGGRVNAFRALTTVTRSGLLQASVSPPSGSALIGSASQNVFVTVKDGFGVTGATVQGSIPGVITNLTFRNDGGSPDATANDNVYSATIQPPAGPATITLTVTSSATNEVSVTNNVFYTIIPVPQNNNFLSSTKAPAAGITNLANNRFATIESGEPRHADVFGVAGSLWWDWTPAANAAAFVDTTGSAVDTVLAVYTGNALTNLTEVAATNDVGFAKQAYLKFNAAAGTTYHIALASVNSSATGPLRFVIRPGGNPDTNGPAVVVLNPLSGLWLTNRIVSLSGTANDPQPNASGVNQVSLTVNDAWQFTADGTTNWSSLAALAPGLNRIRVVSRDVAGNVSAPVSLQLTYYSLGTPNDFFFNAIPLAGSSGTVSATTTNATKEYGEPDHAGVPGGRSVWWTFTPPSDGLLNIDTSGSSFDTVLGLYLGPNVANLTPIAGNDDAGMFYVSSLISQAVRSNQVYRIAVDGYNGASGLAYLNYEFTPAAVYQLSVSSGAGGSVQVNTTNIDGGIAVMPGATGDFAANSTVVLTGLPDPYYQFDSWAGSVTSSDNPLSLVVQSNLDITGRFAQFPFTDGFESGNLLHLTWATAGNAPWFVQSSSTAAGQFAARSGFIGNNQSSSLILSTNFLAGIGSFDYRVSSETNFDALSFSLDGALVQSWSGESPWAHFPFVIAAGHHVLEWRYTKDPSLSAGADAAFIDNVDLPLAVPSGSPTPARLELISQIGGGFVLNLQGQTNQSYVLQTSTNLRDWVNVSTNIAIDGLVHLPVPSGTNRAQFYRAMIAP